MYRQPTTTLGKLPEQKAPKAKLIVLMAFDKGDDGELLPSFEPREMPDERRAIQAAKEMATRHPGVITWSRDAKPDQGEYGEPVVLFQHGDVPDLGLAANLHRWQLYRVWG